MIVLLCTLHEMLWHINHGFTCWHLARFHWVHGHKVRVHYWRHHAYGCTP